mmetsp:Transcript_19073/g.29267  ORF Transcript_19073/g.29267 Transcript_19073/m.29267 type:complete len:107 (+) Transcript_19073:510-830(+)
MKGSKLVNIREGDYTDKTDGTSKAWKRYDQQQIRELDEEIRQLHAEHQAHQRKQAKRSSLPDIKLDKFTAAQDSSFRNQATSRLGKTGKVSAKGNLTRPSESQLDN